MKKIWIILGGIYLYLEFMIIILPFTLSHASDFIPESVDAWFTENYLITAILVLIIPTLFLFISGLFHAVFVTLKNAPVSKDQSVSLLRTQLIMRFVQIPCYICIFLAGLICFLTIFTIAFTFVFAIVDLAAIVITGLFSVPVYISLYKNGLIDKKQTALYSFLSFVFIADVIVSVICYKHVIQKIRSVR
ncbi:MAG: hypothetical protein K5739_01115 [Lachnospiraceae bacterium]|nr:hypothetical protein [Lachnospiraceae bacterium]